MFCRIYFVVKYINHSVNFVTHIIILLEQQLLFKASDICNFAVFQIVNIFEGVTWIIYNMTYCNRFIVYKRVYSRLLTFWKSFLNSIFFSFHICYLYIFVYNCGVLWNKFYVVIYLIKNLWPLFMLFAI